MLSHTTSDNPPLTIICIYHQESKQVQRLMQELSELNRDCNLVLQLRRKGKVVFQTA